MDRSILQIVVFLKGNLLQLSVPASSNSILALFYTGGWGWGVHWGISCVTSQWTLWLSSYFMTLFLSTFVTSHWGHFSKKNFENLKNWKNVFRPFQHQRVPPLKKKFWKLFSSNFCSKSYFFYLNLNFTCS